MSDDTIESNGFSAGHAPRHASTRKGMRVPIGRNGLYLTIEKHEEAHLLDIIRDQNTKMPVSECRKYIKFIAWLCSLQLNDDETDIAFQSFLIQHGIDYEILQRREDSVTARDKKAYMRKANGHGHLDGMLRTGCILFLFLEAMLITCWVLLWILDEPDLFDSGFQDVDYFGFCSIMLTVAINTQLISMPSMPFTHVYERVASPILAILAHVAYAAHLIVPLVAALVECNNEFWFMTTFCIEITHIYYMKRKIENQNQEL
jgi:hypothetical protein